MAKILCLVILALIAISMVATTAMANAHIDRARYGEGSLKGYECGSQCKRRCQKTRASLNQPCQLFCNKCCAKCLCVPPGYSGNKQVCACYNNWKTKKGGPKCP
ncbi:unnamed protein product [Coffea canephora]|uniref:Gibberellin-regulated protein 6 n=2 Tax=Coffea TaxID=13442 RepID=A0A068UVM5_COFCA|nr:gibberellin-regulated protein 6-like [Coffea arabica]XP_027125296.1 gibberellin-regulated protein 6-like [Coffea arabica]CDP12304.1 unnamed protein product [Coffea canephora]